MSYAHGFHMIREPYIQYIKFYKYSGPLQHVKEETGKQTFIKSPFSLVFSASTNQLPISLGLLGMKGE